MKHAFELPQFPNSNFEIESSIWTGRSSLYMDGYELERSSKKGKPYLIPIAGDEIVQITVKNNFPDNIPSLMINGEPFYIARQLTLFQKILVLLPFSLVFIGGLIGTLIGALASHINIRIYRGDHAEWIKYAMVILIAILSYLIYFLMSGIILNLFF